jgi:hypothetical protein
MNIMDKANCQIRNSLFKEILERAEISREYYAVIATHLKIVYEECKESGLSDDQSFSFAKEYIFRDIGKQK